VKNVEGIRVAGFKPLKVLITCLAAVNRTRILKETAQGGTFGIPRVFVAKRHGLEAAERRGKKALWCNAFFSGVKRRMRAD